MKNLRYCYTEDILKNAEGILRIELRLYAPRLKNMKKSNHFNTADELLSKLPEMVYKITYKNFRSLFMLGGFISLMKLNEKYQKADIMKKQKLCC